MHKQQLSCNANEPKEGAQGIVELCTTVAGGFGMALITDRELTGSPKRLQKKTPPCLVNKEQKIPVQGRVRDTRKGKWQHGEVQGVLTLSWQVTAACHPQERPSP